MWVFLQVNLVVVDARVALLTLQQLIDRTFFGQKAAHKEETLHCGVKLEWTELRISQDAVKFARNRLEVPLPRAYTAVTRHSS